MVGIRWLDDLSLDDGSAVGGKNASLGELIRALTPLGIAVPGGFATTAEAYRSFLRAHGLDARIRALLHRTKDLSVDALVERSQEARRLILAAALPEALSAEIVDAYRTLSERAGQAAVPVAVRSSATAEDLPGASFAGQQETFLYVQGEAEVLDSVRRCFASLFTARAVSYRDDMGFDHFEVALSVGVQEMVQSDQAAAGVIFTLDPDSGFRDVVLVTGAYGLGESVVQGAVGPDQFFVHKPTLEKGYPALLSKRVGSKETSLVFDREGHRIRTVPVAEEARGRFCLSDEEVLTLARWACLIEQHYSGHQGAPTPMDIEWAKDGPTGRLFVVQARPETVHATREAAVIRIHRLKEKAEPLVSGLAVGEAIASGTAHVIDSPKEMRGFRSGEVLVTRTTDPDWEPILKRSAAVITERGGRTSHAAIVARELGIPAVVGAEGARTAVTSGAPVTVSCAEGEVGRVYAGALPFEIEEISPERVPSPKTRVMMNLANPELAFKMAQLPNDGVGLARMEFVFASWVRVHPLALTRYPSLSTTEQREIDALTQGFSDKVEYFIERLAGGIATIAGAFWPKPVILRFSDFKTNEYANLLGGRAFEPAEANPMIGWRGASRYYHPEYREGFLLEVEAVRRVREVRGLDNLEVMIPFCRTPEEGQRVLDTMAEGGLARGKSGLEVYVMAEIPSNILLADRFAELFDGFSIGSNDLTQLTLGVDRDSERIAPLFDDRSEAIRRSCLSLIETAHGAGRKVGICGQAPSDDPEFAAFLVESGIDSISVTPDVLVRTRMKVFEIEARRAEAPRLSNPDSLELDRSALR